MADEAGLHDEAEEGLGLTTLTLGELIEDLQAVAEELGSETPVFLTARHEEEGDLESSWAVYDITAGAPDDENPEHYIAFINGVGQIPLEEEEEE
jgi:hypothetical protein